jgi:hypothetical protein
MSINFEILKLIDHPGVITDEWVEALTGRSKFEISILVAEGLLKPIGQNRKHNAVKKFHAAEIKEKKQDRIWNEKCQRAIDRFWANNKVRYPRKRSPNKAISAVTNALSS